MADRFVFSVNCTEANGRFRCSGSDGQDNKVDIQVSSNGQATLNNITAEITKAFINCKKNNVSVEFEYVTLTENQIPVILCYPKDAKNLPLVFLNHGTSGDSIGSLYNGGIELSQEGFFVVLPDARLHGRRRAPNFNELIHVKENYKAAYLKMLRETCADLSMLIDYFQNDERVDSERIGTTGISQGGYVSFMAITLDKRIKVAAPIIGSPDLEDEYGNSPPFDSLDEALKCEVILHSPLRNFEKMPPVALLIQNGDADTIVPVGGVRRLHEKIEPMYQGMSDNYQYIEYPGIAHDYIPEMRSQMIDWMKAKL